MKPFFVMKIHCTVNVLSLLHALIDFQLKDEIEHAISYLLSVTSRFTRVKCV